MSIQVASWADFGYRKLGQLPTGGGGLSTAEMALRLTGVGDYEATSDCWIRKLARRKGVTAPQYVESVVSLDRGSSLDADRLTCFDQHAKSKWVAIEGTPGVPRIRTKFDELVMMLQETENEEPAKRAYRLMQALLMVGPERLGPLFRLHVAPRFFSSYPGGRIVILRYGWEFDTSAAMMRCMYASAQAPLPQLANEGFPGVKTLIDWHFTSLTVSLPVWIDFFNFMSYPLVGGTCVNLPGIAFVFLMDPVEKHGDCLAA